MEEIENKEERGEPTQVVQTPGLRSLPAIYCNSFSINFSPTDIQILLGLNAAANVNIVLSHVLAKNFSASLSRAISDLEKMMGAEIPEYQKLKDKLILP